MCQLALRARLATDFVTAKPGNYGHDPITRLGTNGGVERDRPYAWAVDDPYLELELTAGLRDFDASLEPACPCFDASVHRQESRSASSQSGPACPFLERSAEEPYIAGWHANSPGERFVAYGRSPRSNLREVPVGGLDPSDSERG
jgi:hypothetical protein